MGRSRFLTTLVTEEILGSEYARLTRRFCYYSNTLQRVIAVPKGFVCDYESVPLFKATSKRAGVIHDYLCRIDSDPVVTKQLAATIYNEAQALRDDMMGYGWCKKAWRSILRAVKTSTVRVAWGYFHKFRVMATVDEISK